MTSSWLQTILKPGAVTAVDGIWVANGLLNKKFKWSFAEPVLSHPDNPIGFGMVASKKL